MTRTPTRRARLATLALATSLVLVACGDDDGEATVTPGDVEVTDLGAEAGRIQLPGDAEVGQSATTSMQVLTDVGLSGPIDQETSVAVRLDVTTVVVEVDEDGGYVVEAEFIDAAALDAPDGADLSSLADIVGIRFRQAFPADGTTGDPEVLDEASLTPAQRAAFEELGGNVQSASFAYPDEPVGEGATWTAWSTIASQGLEVDVPYEYELVSLHGNAYEIEVSYRADVDERMTFSGERAHVTGTVAGGGRTSGTIDNPLGQASTIRQELDFDIEIDGETLSMSLDIVMEAQPR
jgi:hypothetical protein